MDQPEVRNFMQGYHFKAPVYMISGLKIGRGGSLQSSSNRDENNNARWSKSS